MWTLDDPMGSSIVHRAASEAWRLAASQHGVVSRRQLLELGLSPQAIQHRIKRGRLHRVDRGVYSVGRPELSQRGRWMAAVIACGPGAVLSHGSAAALWGIDEERGRLIDVAVPASSRCRREGVRTHRCRSLKQTHVARNDGIPVTTVIRTLVDNAAHLDRAAMERAVNEADRLGLVDPESLRSALDFCGGVPGVASLRTLLDRRTFRLTDSDLERRFLAIVDATGLARPLTRQRLNGFRVDFHWPDLGLVVETDGLRYHRTPAQQARDRVRDQAHTAAGLVPLRFTHEQVRYEPDHVRRTLEAVVRRIGGGRSA
jgi:very-short-patch-repair endonuclease